jgi:HEAT repeat protein
MLSWLRQLFSGEKRSRSPSLVEQALSRHAEVRRLAATLLGEVSERWAADELLRLLADSHTSVREEARQSLWHQGTAALPALLDAVSGSEVEAARVSAERLGELRPPEAIEPLLVALKFSSRPVQMAARRALEQYGAAALPVLRPALAEQQPWVRRQIEEIIARAEAQPEVAKDVRPAGQG